jgi:membrane protein implicated in regulation of membrane protease activity
MIDFGSPRMLVLMTLATALVLGGILALATGSWWALLIPVVLHVIGTTLVIAGVFKRIDQGDKPDPVTEARLDDQGAR